MDKLSPTDQVEGYLREERRYNEDHDILPSNNIVIDRLLANGINMSSVYSELLDKAPPGKPDGMTCERWQLVMGAIVEVAAGWNPDKINIVRDDVKRVKELNTEIKKAASNLAILLRKRAVICERSSIARPLDYHPLDLLEPAAKISDITNPSLGDTHYRYIHWVKKSVDATKADFGLKYWPRTADLIDALAEAQIIDPLPENALDAAAIEVSQSSIRDFLRAFNAAMEDIKSLHDIDINFSHRALADFTSCALDLDDPIEESAIKKFMADERKRKR